MKALMIDYRYPEQLKIELKAELSELIVLKRR